MLNITFSINGHAQHMHFMFNSAKIPFCITKSLQFSEGTLNFCCFTIYNMLLRIEKVYTIFGRVLYENNTMYIHKKIPVFCGVYEIIVYYCNISDSKFRNSFVSCVHQRRKKIVHRRQVHTYKLICVKYSRLQDPRNIYY